MPNRQLVDYIRTMLSQNIDIGELRNILLREGWSMDDIEVALSQARKPHQRSHTHFVAVAVLVIIILLLGLAIFLVAFSRSPVPTTADPGAIHETFSAPWQDCAKMTDSVQKDECYQQVHQTTHINCKTIESTVEQSFCFRAQETVILAHYNS